MRKALRILFAVLAAAGFLAAAGSFLVERDYASRAKLVQRMQIDPADDLFGTGGTPVGSPQRMIVDDPKAFTGKRTETGAEVVDEAYLEANGVYPLQMQTVSYVAGLVRGAGLGAMLLGGLGWLVVWRGRRRSATASA